MKCLKHPQKKMKYLTMKKSSQMIAICLLCSTNSIAQESADQNELAQKKVSENKSAISTIYPHLFVGAKGGYQLSTLDDMPKQGVLGAFIGTQFTEHWSWDLGYQYHGDSSINTKNTEINVFDTAIRYDWYIAKDISLYGKLGAAYWSIDANERYKKPVNENGFSPLAEVGVNYRITPNIYLNAGYQYIDEVGSNLTGHYDSRTLMAGVSYHFKGKTVATPLSPSTIIAAPSGTTTSKVTTSKVTKLFETTLFANVAFDFNSDTIIESPAVTAEVDQFIRLLDQYPEAQGVVIGHTDSIGTEHYNKQLSEKRAQSVVQALKQKGVDMSRLRIVAEGESQPIASNMYAEGRSKNRRVELIILSFNYTESE